MMLGLKRGAVTLAIHQKSWAETFHHDRKIIFQLLQDKVIDIQHVGSTAIEGIEAKPIIDILVGLDHFNDIERYIPKLEEKSYIYRPHASRAERLLFIKGGEDYRTHHIHIVHYDSYEWRRLIFFRDYLREHPQTALEYMNIKRELARRYHNNREEYTKGKEVFIKEIEKLM